MIPLSSAASRQSKQLIQHYAKRGRTEAIANLLRAIEQGSARYLAHRGLFFDAPRPYPRLRSRGWTWTKERSYWIAFSTTGGEPVVTAVLHDRSNIPRRL